MPRLSNFVHCHRNSLTDTRGKVHQIFDHEYFYLLPTKTCWYPDEPIGSPFQFGFVRHNATKGQGIVSAMEDLLVGITPTTQKAGLAGQAENLFEEVRRTKFPDRPSRLRCHFLNYDQETAKARQSEWGWQNREIASVYLILSSAVVHHGDIRLFERAAGGELTENLALEYWAGGEIPREHIEILANAALYFPNWQQFDELHAESLLDWQRAVSTRKELPD